MLRVHSDPVGTPSCNKSHSFSAKEHWQNWRSSEDPPSGLGKRAKISRLFFFWMNRTVEIRYTGVFPSKNHIQSWMKLPEMIRHVAAEPRTGNVSCAGRRKPGQFSSRENTNCLSGPPIRDPRYESQACLKSMPCGRFWELWTICLLNVVESSVW